MSVKSVESAPSPPCSTGGNAVGGSAAGSTVAGSGSGVASPNPFIPCEQLDNPLLVEVQGENGAYYHAHVRDVFKEEILLSFENDWQPRSRFPFSRIRLPPPPRNTEENAVVISPGQEIEVFSRASDQESCGWWRAMVKMIKGGFFVVDYLGWDTTYAEIVPARAPSAQKYSTLFIS